MFTGLIGLRGFLGIINIFNTWIPLPFVYYFLFLNSSGVFLWQSMNWNSRGEVKICPGDFRWSYGVTTGREGP